jgi:enamine deaminase RidA (YjgF/YER057c/UK114 family)
VRPRFLDPDGLLKPPGYSQVVSTPTGSLVWMSGQVAFDSQGQVVGVGSWEQQPGSR